MRFQINGPIMDLCVLSILKTGPAYGYRLTQEMKRFFPVSESTLYPVLRRLCRQGLLETYDVQTDGRNRRYYRLTQAGIDTQKETRSEWIAFADTINRLLEENGEKQE